MNSSPRTFINFAQLVEFVAKTYDTPRAFNYRSADQWTSIATSEFVKQVRYLSLALHQSGVKKGERVGILAFPSPFWLMADLAIMSIGAVSVPFFPSGSEENLEFKLANCGLKQIFVFCPDSWPRLSNHLQDIGLIIVKDFQPANPKVISFERFLQQGEELMAQQPNLLRALGDQVLPDDLATIIYTSGSTGVPKGVELTHQNIISQVHGCELIFPLDATKDKALSCLPLAHSFERMVVYYYIASGVPVYFNDDTKKLGDDLKEIKPTIIILVPRILEKVFAKIQAKIQAASLIEKMIGSWALKIGLTHNPETDKPGLFFKLADLLVFKKFRQALGGRIRIAISGGAALKFDLYRFFVNIGLPVFQGYGLTESSPVLSGNYPGHHKIGTVGPAFPGVELKISPQGEILAKGLNIMRGYHQLPEETAQMIDAAGWLHTGDLGSIDSQGYLTITGRIKELLKTSAGKYVSPVPIEQALSASPFIDLAMVIAEGRAFVTCLLFPEQGYLKAHQSEAKVQIKALIEAVNSKLDRSEQIKDYRLLMRPITIEAGDLTPTMKLKRYAILKKYEALIDEMYKERSL